MPLAVSAQSRTTYATAPSPTGQAGAGQSTGWPLIGAQLNSIPKPSWGSRWLQPSLGNWGSNWTSATPHPAVVRVIVPERDGTSYGSGTLVDVNGQYGLVLTNWHVVADGTGPVSVVFANGFRSAAQVAKLDRDWDLAALVVWKTDVQPVKLATAAPRPGEWLTIAGYGSGSYRASAGQCTQYVSPGTNLPAEMVELSTAARQGDSGGPIFNSRGELAGVLFGAGGGTTSGSYCGRVNQFLASVLPNGDTVPNMPASPTSPATPPPMVADARSMVPLPPRETPTPRSAHVEHAEESNPWDNPSSVEARYASRVPFQDTTFSSDRPAIASTSASNHSEPSHATWQDFTNHPQAGHIGTFLAIIGIAGMMVKGVCGAQSPAPAKAKKKPAKKAAKIVVDDDDDDFDDEDAEEDDDDFDEDEDEDDDE